jgi:hypothetical protein
MRFSFTPLTNRDEIDLRARGVVTGGALGVATAIAAIAYLAQTPGNPHRELMVVTCCVWGC